MRRALLAACLLLGACGGLPLPTPGAIACGSDIYVEPGSILTCPAALSVVRNAQEELGVRILGRATVEFVAAENLAEFGHADALGSTEGTTIAIVASHAQTIFHEALHLDDHTHCNWSTKWLPMLEANYVVGEFYDECARVTCSSTRQWTDSTGQVFGNTYICL